MVGQGLGLAVLGDRDGAGVAALAVELDHVVVRDDLTVGGDDHAGALVLVAVDLTSMETTAGITLLTSCGDGDVAAEHGCAGCRVALVDGDARPAAAVALLSARAVTPAPMAAADEGGHDRHGQPGPELARRAAAARRWRAPG